MRGPSPHFLVAVICVAAASLGPGSVPQAASPEGTGSISTFVVRGSDGMYPVRTFVERETVFVNVADVAWAAGAKLEYDSRHEQTILSLGPHRIVIPSEGRRIEVDGDRRRLSEALRTRDADLYAPKDLLDDVLPPLLGRRLTLEADQTPAPAAPGGQALPGAGSRPAGQVGAIPPSATSPAGTTPGGEPPLPRRARTPGVVRTIVLDPGHGGEEKGAEGPTGLLEKDVTLDVSQRLRQRLQARGYEVFLTRTGDENLPLDERTAVANNRSADLFISLHANASPALQARGAETYFLSLSRLPEAGAPARGGPGDDLVPPERERQDPLRMILWDLAQASSIAESSVFAETLQAEFNRTLDLRDRGVKQAPFRVLVGATMPAVLVEIGFISNAEEETRLRDPQFLDTLAEAMAKAIDAYRDQLRSRGFSLDPGWKPAEPPSRP